MASTFNTKTGHKSFHHRDTQPQRTLFFLPYTLVVGEKESSVSLCLCGELSPGVSVVNYDHSTDRSMAGIVVRPVLAMAIASSLFRMFTARATPGAPPAANP
jgi:hypothetical protein